MATDRVGETNIRRRVVVTTQISWKEWRLQDWNRRLFDHFFGLKGEDIGPVSRIVVTSEELLRLTEDSRALAEEALQAFRLAVNTRLARSGVSLCKDAERLERATYRTGAGDDIPPYFAHLVVTCIAASGTDTKTPNSEFRRRLNRFLDRGSDNSSYSLGSLPRLWEMLQAWLKKAADRGEPFRTLILKRPDHLKLIGYSVQLAFPGIKDQGRLSKALAGLTLPPPVAEVFARIDPKLHRFSERFQHAYSTFRNDYYRKESGLASRPFWSAVIDAIQRAPDAFSQCADDKPRFHLRLDEDLSWKYSLSLLADRHTRDTPRCRSCLLGDASSNGFGFLVDRLADDGVDVGAMVLDNTITDDFPELATSELIHAVKWRLLLFTQDDDGVWMLSTSRPAINKVRALIHTELASAFETRINHVASGPTVRPSRYHNWSEVGEFGADALAKANFVGTPLEGLRCLADVITPPRITLSEGVRLDGAWLGRRAALPRVTVNRSTATPSIEPIHSGHVPPWVIELAKTDDEEGSYRFPSLLPIDCDLEGEFLIRCRGDAQLPPTRVRFHHTVNGVDYRGTAEPSAWFVEAAHTPTLSVADRAAGDSALLTESLREGSLPQFDRMLEASPDFDEPPEVTALTDILAGISLRRAGIAEHDLYAWFSQALGVASGLTWGVIRAWLESGLLDQFSRRRWRSRVYFARRPQLIVYRAKEGKVGATLVGLIPMGFARRVEEESKQFGITAFRIGRPGRCVPRPISFLAESLPLLTEFAGRLSIGTPQPPPLLSDVVGALKDVLLRSETIPGGYALERKYNVGEAHVEWHKRDDAPDFFLALSRAGESFGTWSRNWSFLAATTFSRTTPFETRNGTTLVRSSTLPVYLPIALARWATIASGVSPCPTENSGDGVRYQYEFPNTRHLKEAIGYLWPTAFPPAIIFTARWIAQLTHSHPRHGLGPPIILPITVREAMASCKQIAGCERLSSLVTVPARIFPHVIAFAQSLDGHAAIQRRNTP